MSAFDLYSTVDRKRSRDPRVLLGQAMLGAGQTPAKNAWEGVSQAAKSILGAVLMSKANKEYDAKEDKRMASLSAALSKSGVNVPQGLNAQDALSMALLQKQLAPKPPESRTVNRGDQSVTQEFSNGAWTDIETAPRWETKPQDTFETIENPYGFGGAGQKNMTTGEITDYQSAPKGNGVNYKTRKTSLPGGQIQDEESLDGGLTWKPVGATYDRRDPFMIQDVVQPDGTVERIMMPKPGKQAADTNDMELVSNKIDPDTGGQVLSTKPKEFNGEQSKAAGFAHRMVQARGEMGRVKHGPDGKQGSEDDFKPSNWLEKSRAAIGNFAASPEYQQYKQAQEDWVRAKLRKESGAVIGEEEMANEIKTYFPQFGDSDEVLAQKDRARKIAEDALIKESQGAYENMFGTPNPATVQPQGAFQRRADGVMVWTPSAGLDQSKQGARQAVPNNY